MIRSHYVGELSADMDGKDVTLAGWVHEIRETSNITFLLIRDKTGIAQVIGKKGVTGDDVRKRMSLPKESVIVVRGKVKANKEARAGFEVIPTDVADLNPLSAKIPFEVTGKVPAEIDVRLNNRYVDIRRLQTTAIFNIESTLMGAFRTHLSGEGFQEIRTPSVIAEASEGGAELFPVAYFEKEAYLAQSPQLYKQLAVIGGLDKVFMITPVFRAEKSNTVYHLTESTQMDIEAGFAYAEDAIGYLSGTVLAMLEAVKRHNQDDLDTLGVKLDVPKVETVTYSDAIKALQAKGHDAKVGDDFTRKHETGLQEIYGDAVVITDFPTALRAFYSMPKEDNPDLTNSYDFIYKGLEISSGAQRIHKPDLLIKSLEKKGLNPKKFEFYINAFRCGAPPHSGWSIGLERLAMQVTNSNNIRECSMFPRDRNRLTP